MWAKAWVLLASWLPALLGLWPSLSAAARQEVMVSVLPLQWLVDRIGGEAVQTRTLVAPGRDPHTFEPTPRQMAELARARLYVRVGVPFEQALIERIRAINPDMSVLDVRQGLRLRAMEGAGRMVGGPSVGTTHADPDETEDARDPHVWTSPANLIHMAGLVRDRLTALDPQHAGLYRQHDKALAGDLASLDRDLRTRLAALRGRAFMVFHPSWGYFADAYGLEQIPLEYEGKAPGPRTLAASVERARREGIRKIFVQPQLDQRAARTLAAAIGATVVTVDPLAYEVGASLRALADQIAEGP